MTTQVPAAHLEAIHRATLLDSLNKFKLSDTFTDITLVVKGHTYKAHKLILASYSDYFRSMFTDGMLESKQNTVNISGVTSIGLSAVLNYMYTSKLQITEFNVQDVLAASVYTQVFPVVQACTQFLKYKMDVDNCTDIVTIAENYSLQELREDVLNFISASVDSVAKTKDFHRLTPEQIEYVVMMDMPINMTELDLLRVILLWFWDDNGKQQSLKLNHSETILKHIRFYDIVPSQLQSMLDQLVAEKKLSTSLFDTIMKISYKTENNLRVPIMKHTFNTRGMKPAIVKIGGFGMNGLTNDLNFSYMDERHWRHLGVIPHVEQCNYGTAVVNNELYIVGGCFNQMMQEVIHPFAFKFNPRTNMWLKIRSMALERCRFTLNALNDKLYAVAGSTETENGYELEATKTAECYDVSTGHWSNIESLPESRQQHAAVGFNHAGSDMLFISGGLLKDRVIASMFVYSVEKNTWTSCAPLLTPRADHFMIVYNYKIYVCGGWREDPHARHLRIQVPSIDVYDVINNTWSFVTNVPTPRYHAGVVAYESKIYFVGGFHNDAMFRKDTAEIECYDILKNTWARGEKNSQDYWEHSCVMLHIPKYN